MLMISFRFVCGFSERMKWNSWDSIGCLYSFPPAGRRYLHNKRLHVVSNKWLEDSVEKQMKLSETAYNLKPDTLEELEIERR